MASPTVPDVGLIEDTIGIRDIVASIKK